MTENALESTNIRAIVPAHRTSQQVVYYENKLHQYQAETDQPFDNRAFWLKPTESGILTEVLAKAEASGKVTMPLRLKGIPWFEKLEDPALRRDPDRKEPDQDLVGRYLYLREVPEHVLQFRPKRGARQFRLPEGYEDATYDNFDIDCPEQQQARDFLVTYGANPPQGLYLWGDVGNGKTRLLVSFAHDLLTKLIMEYIQRIEEFADGAISEYEDLWVNQFGLTKADIYNLSFDQMLRLRQRLQGEEGARLRDVFTRHHEAAMAKYPHQPTEVAYSTFDDLYEHRDDTDAITDFINRKVVIIDDIHTRDKYEIYEFAQKLLESRYNIVRQGPTFVTSNLPPEELFARTNKVDYPEKLTTRMKDRLEEMFWALHITAPSRRQVNAQVAREQIRQDLGFENMGEDRVNFDIKNNNKDIEEKKDEDYAF
jgi:DNA replication protein DnaC